MKAACQKIRKRKAKDVSKIFESEIKHVMNRLEINKAPTEDQFVLKKRSEVVQLRLRTLFN